MSQASRSESSDGKEQKKDSIEENEFLKSLINNLSDGIIVCDAEGRLVLFNQAIQEFYGLDREQILSDRLGSDRDIYYADGKTPMRIEDLPLFRALHGESFANVEITIASKDGHLRQLFTNGAPIFNSQGEKLGAFVIMRDVTEYKQTKAALQEHQQFLNSIYEEVEEAIFIVDVLPQKDFRYLYFNPAAESLTGISLDSIRGKKPEDIVSPEAAIQIRQHYDRCVETETKITYEECLPLKGKETWWLTTLKPLRDRNSRIYHLIGTSLNITDRKQSEANALSLNQQLEQQVIYCTNQMEDFAKLSPVGIFRTDCQGNCFYVNDRLCEITGMSSEQTLNATWFDAIYSEDKERVISEWDFAVETKTTFQSEFRLQRPDGSTIWILSQAIPALEKDEELVGYVVSLADITELKKSQDALEDTEEELRATFERVAVGVAHVDINGKWLRVNQKLCDIVGYSREELLEKTFQEITYPEDLETDLNYVRQLLNGEIETYNLEKRYIHKDGSLVWIDLTVSLVKTRTFKPKYFIAAIEEINDRKQSEIALKQRAEELEWLTKALTQTTNVLKKRNDELDRFAYVISHDLKAPLRAIANLSEWIEEDLEDKLPPENQHQMQLLRGRVYRLEALINGLLEYSRVGRIEIIPETVNVNKLLTKIINSLAPPSTFSFEIESNLPTIKTKRVALSQVFSNLIANAIEHHDRSDGHIKISGLDRGEFYEFAITDDGAGIDPEYHEKVFTIFQTLQPRDRKENTGIGLAIVKKIIENEGGTISLESQLGRGATFRFTWRSSN